MELHLEEQWPETLDHIARAASLIPDEAPEALLVELAAESGLNAARALLDDGEDGEDSWPGVVGLLEKAIAVAPDAGEVRAELTAAHTRGAAALSAEAANSDYVLALAHVRRALELLPDDPAANRLLRVVLAKRARLLSRPGPDRDLLEAVQWWQELTEIDPDPAHRAGLSHALRLLSCSAALVGHRTLALKRMAWALAADPKWSGDAPAEAPRRIAALLIADAMEDGGGRPFEERALRLRTARRYRDSPELRELMIALWRNEAIIRYDTRFYRVCAALLEEALYLAGDPDASASFLRSDGAGYRTDTALAIHWRWYPQARSLMKRTVDHFPDDDVLRELRDRIDLH
jgi:hypothetical protein